MKRDNSIVSVKTKHLQKGRPVMSDLTPIKLEHKNKIRLLLDKGWTPEQIQRRRYRKYTTRQIGAVRGWMRRGKY